MIYSSHGYKILPTIERASNSKCTLFHTKKPSISARLFCIRYQTWLMGRNLIYAALFEFECANGGAIGST